MNGVSLATMLYFGYKSLSMAAPVILLMTALVFALFLLKKLGYFNKGNRKAFDPEQMTENPKSCLKGKNVIFLGSSVTAGFMSHHKAFPEMLAASEGIRSVKEAVSGTTLAVKGSGKSYVERVQKIDPKTPCDVFVCQLSTNDATFKIPLGEISADENYDTSTVSGAIEFILDYVKKTWNCPVLFYTNPLYGSEPYAAMRSRLLELADKWNFGVIDFWGDEAVRGEMEKKRSHCMNDSIHPTKKGYRMMTPVFAAAMAEALRGEVVKAHAWEADSGELKKRAKKSRNKLVWGIIGRVLLAVFLGTTISSGIMLNDGLGIVKAGNASRYDPENYPVLETSPLKDKVILCVGSSVTQGYAAKNVSFIEYINHIDQARMIKEVYPATTVTTKDEHSYYPRLRTYTAEDPIDAVIIQLSSNDSTFGSGLGSISDGMDINALDEYTFCGAMEGMIAYSQQTWGCPVLVYCDPAFRVKCFYDADTYYEMVRVTDEICRKWGAEFINLWDDPEVSSIPIKDYKFYMSDVVHPTKAGYAEWWTPIFQERLYALFPAA